MSKVTLREKNEKMIKHLLINNPHVKGMREAMMKKYGVDPVTDIEKFNFQEGKVSFKKLYDKFQEADVSSGFTQFLRAGIQQNVNHMYEVTEVSYTDWVTVQPSKKDTELYAPNHGVSFPRQIGKNEKYPEVGMAALDLEMKNYKFGSMWTVGQELFDDDQSATIAAQSGMLGEYLAVLAEVLCMGKLASVANMKYIDYVIPTSETKPTNEANYPWSAALVGGGQTKATTFSRFTQASFQTGRVVLKNQRNLQGIKMQVAPKRVICGTNQELDVKTVLNSSYYPQGAATAGGNYGAFAANILKGVADVTVSSYMFKQDGTVNGDSTAWYLVDDSKPWFVLQMREPVSVIQENPESGQSFEEDIYRFKSKCRQNADFIDPRFAYIGNDGSV